MRANRKGGFRGFTLIECMIAAALLAIMLGGGIQIVNAVHLLTREVAYGDAVRQMKRQKRHVLQTAFASIPPEIKTVPANGIVTLGKHAIIPDSISIVPASQRAITSPTVKGLGVPFKVDYDTNTVAIEAHQVKGKDVVITYQFYAPEEGEGGTVPATAPHAIILTNKPVRHVDSVRMAISGESIDQRDYAVDMDAGIITFNKKFAGKPVRVVYTGSQVRSVCTSRFVDRNFASSANSTDVKLVKITTSYGGRRDLEMIQMKVK